MAADIASREVERAFLAALCRAGLANPDKARQALLLSNVTPEAMFYPEHRAILQAAEELLQQRKFTDEHSLWATLKRSQIIEEQLGGLDGLMELLAEPAGSKLIAQHGETIREHQARRHMVTIASTLVALASDKSVPAAQALDECQKSLAAMTLGKRETRTALTMLTECVDEMEAVWEGRKEGTLKTGLESLDLVIGGLQPTLIVIGGLPGAGKSALLASIVSNLAAAGHKVGVFSLEDEGKWLTWRFLARDSRVSQFVLRNRKLFPGQSERVAKAFDQLKTYAGNVVVDDRSGLTPDEVVQESRNMIVNHGVKAIFVDHAGELRFRGGHGERHDLELADALSTLRGIAKAHSVPIIVFAHLKRRPGLEPGDEPKLNDFADASAFERKSRIALGLSRKPDSNVLAVTLLKQTNGAPMFKGSGGGMTNTIRLEFEGLAAMVRDVEGQVTDPYLEEDQQQEGERYP